MSCGEHVELIQDGASAEALVVLVDEQSLQRERQRLSLTFRKEEFGTLNSGLPLHCPRLDQGFQILKLMCPVEPSSAPALPLLLPFPARELVAASGWNARPKPAHPQYPADLLGFSPTWPVLQNSQQLVAGSVPVCPTGCLVWHPGKFSKRQLKVHPQDLPRFSPPTPGFHSMGSGSTSCLPVFASRPSQPWTYLFVP